MLIDLKKIEYKDIDKIVADPCYSKLIPKKLKMMPKINRTCSIKIGDIFLYVNDIQKEIELRGIINQLKSSWVEIKYYNGRIKQILRSELFEALTSLVPYEVILIREFLATEYCGYAWLNCRSEVFIEAMIGGFYGLWYGDETPAWFIADRRHITDICELKTVKRYYDYNYESRIWEMKTLEKGIRISLRKEHLQSVCDTVYKANELFLRPKIEWIITNGELALFDVVIPVEVNSL